MKSIKFSLVQVSFVVAKTKKTRAKELGSLLFHPKWFFSSGLHPTYSFYFLLDEEIN
jgi:hypothetical protein